MNPFCGFMPKNRYWLASLLAGLFLLVESSTVVSGCPCKRKDSVNAQYQFGRFARTWVHRLSENFEGKKENPVILKRDGQYVAQFITIDDGSLSTRVDKTSSSDAPYIGIMTYDEYLYESNGENPQIAQRGSFRIVKKTRITEIFLFRKGHWVTGLPE